MNASRITLSLIIRDLNLRPGRVVDAIGQFRPQSRPSFLAGGGLSTRKVELLKDTRFDWLVSQTKFFLKKETSVKTSLQESSQSYHGSLEHHFPRAKSIFKADCCVFNSTKTSGN